MNRQLLTLRAFILALLIANGYFAPTLFAQGKLALGFTLPLASLFAVLIATQCYFRSGCVPPAAPPLS